MTMLVISTGAQFGQITNQLVGNLFRMNGTMPRLQEAIATASSGYTGLPGTQFEVGNDSANQAPGPNLFGVQADPDHPGQQGEAYSYAVGQLQIEWAKFWTAAAAYIEALDNGQ